MTSYLLKDRIWAKVKLWKDISRQRRELGMLSDHTIKDLGISRVDAEREANRPFWDNASCYDISLRKRDSSSQDTCVEKYKLKKLSSAIN